MPEFSSQRNEIILALSTGFPQRVKFQCAIQISFSSMSNVSINPALKQKLPVNIQANTEADGGRFSQVNV